MASERNETTMKNTFKNTAKFLSVIALCFAVSACSQPAAGNASNGSFPAYSTSQGVASPGATPMNLMDFGS